MAAMHAGDWIVGGRGRLARPAAAVCAAAAAFALALSPPPAKAEIKEQIVAVVNDEIITYSEIEKILAPIFEQYERVYSGAELFTMLQKARQDVVEHLVEERLILQEAKALKVKELMGEEFAKETDRMVAEAKRKFPTEEEFRKTLEREGTTFEKFRAGQEERALVKGMMIKEVSSRCSVSPAEVRDYYETHPSEFTEPEKIHASQIWLRENAAKAGDAQRLADELVTRLDAGEDFAELAKKYSQCPYASRGGDWGFIARGHWNKELEDAAFALEPGAHSGVVKTTLGCHIIMVRERQPASVKPLAEVYAGIEEKLFQAKAGKKRDEWIKRLKKKSYVSITS